MTTTKVEALKEELCSYRFNIWFELLKQERIPFDNQQKRKTETNLLVSKVRRLFGVTQVLFVFLTQ